MRISLAVAALLLLMRVQSSGAVLAGYEFTTDTNPTTEDANVTASVFLGNFAGNGGGTRLIRSSNSYFLASSLSVNANQFESTEATSISSPDYFGFTVTPDSGFSLDLESLTFTFGGLRATAGNGGSNYTANYAVRSNVDSFAANLQTGSFNVTSTSAATFSGTQTADLSALAFDSLSGPVEFRVYFWASTAPTASSASGWNANQITIDTVALNGVAVPEPGTYALMAMGAAGCLVLVRRKAKRVS